MLMTYETEKEFRQHCREYPKFDFYDAYDNLEIDDEDRNISVHDSIETELLKWIKKNAKARIFYNGDLEFAFESAKERDQFDLECGGIAFKLRWT